MIGVPSLAPGQVAGRTSPMLESCGPSTWQCHMLQTAVVAAASQVASGEFRMRILVSMINQIQVSRKFKLQSLLVSVTPCVTAFAISSALPFGRLGRAM